MFLSYLHDLLSVNANYAQLVTSLDRAKPFCKTNHAAFELLTVLTSSYEI